MNEKCFCHIGMADGTRYKVKDADARSSIETINGDIETINNNIENINNEIENKELTEVVVIGDSYSSKSYLPNNELWCEIVANTLNLTLHNYAEAGAGFLADGDEKASTFSTQLDEANNDTSFNNNKVKYVLIYGGTNDLEFFSGNNKNDYISAYENTFVKARNYYPKAKIVYLGCDSFASLRQKTMTDGEIISEFWVGHTIKNNSTIKAQNIIFIDLTLFFMGVPVAFQNGFGGHPNATAHEEFATAVLNGLFSSGCAYNHIIIANPETTSDGWTFDTTLSGTNNHTMRITDKEINFDITTFAQRSNTSDNFLVKFPYNFRIPKYSTNSNPLIPDNMISDVWSYSSGHNVGALSAMGNTLAKNSSNGIQLFVPWTSNTGNMYDFCFNKTIFY